MANVTFLGACGVVTGSSTLLSWGENSAPRPRPTLPLSRETVPW